MVLRWASMHGLHWGSEIVFTYGPLGYLYPLNACDPGTYGGGVARRDAPARDILLDGRLIVSESCGASAPAIGNPTV